MLRIFVNYRRDDSAAYAGRLYDRLVKEFGEDHVFMDIDRIAPGEDFVEVIRHNLESCDVALALIGKTWLSCVDEAGARRLDNPDDFVRMELSAGLTLGVRVIPVLVAGASMPRPTQLPEELVALSRRNAIEISDARFHLDVDRLIEALRKTVDSPIGVMSRTERGTTTQAPEKLADQGPTEGIKHELGQVTQASYAAAAVTPAAPARQERLQTPTFNLENKTQRDGNQAGTVGGPFVGECEANNSTSNDTTPKTTNAERKFLVFWVLASVVGWGSFLSLLDLLKSTPDIVMAFSVFTGTLAATAVSWSATRQLTTQAGWSSVTASITALISGILLEVVATFVVLILEGDLLFLLVLGKPGMTGGAVADLLEGGVSMSTIFWIQRLAEFLCSLQAAVVTGVCVIALLRHYKLR